MTEGLIIGMGMFLFGSIIGSFLNVCIVRLPQEKSVVTPRSHCVHCQRTIPWYDNIPFFSYLILRGKCRFCGAKISFRYFLVELITAFVFLFFYRYYGLTVLLWPYLVMVCGFIVATFVDFEHRIIPNEVSQGGMIGGVVFSFFIPMLHSQHFGYLIYGRVLMWVIVVLFFLIEAIAFLVKKESFGKDDLILFMFIIMMVAGDFAIKTLLPVLQDSNMKWLVPHLLSLDVSITGLLVGGGSIYLMGILGDVLFKKESMGAGDVKLLAMVGSFLGWQMAVLAFFIAPFFGAIYGIIEKIRTKDSHIAYGPFLVLGSLICLFWGDQIIDWIMRGYGLA